MLEPIAVRAPADRQVEPFARTTREGRELRGARAAALPDDALAGIPGLFAHHRGTFALDTRLVIRGAGARSAFGVRGVTVLLDGVPQTLPDGQANLAHVVPAALARVDVVRGATAAFYGNAAGGVVALRTAPLLGARPGASLRTVTGREGAPGPGAGSAAVRSTTASLNGHLGAGGVGLVVSETRQDGWREHADGLVRQGALGLEWPASAATRVGARVRVSDLARASNPGALDSAQLAVDPRQAQPRNTAFAAGKRATEWQGSLDVARLGARSEVSAVAFGVTRDLDNPLPTAWVRLDRADLGLRLAGRWRPRPDAPGAELSLGFDVQRQRDDRLNFANDSGRIGTTALLDQRETVTALGARAALRAPVAPRTGALAGVRLDRVTFDVRDRLTGDGDASGRRAMGALSFTTAVVHRAGPLHAQIGLGSAFETPTTTELARPGSGGFNDALRPQTALQWEASLGWRQSAGTATLTVYRTRVRDALVPVEEPTAPGRFYFVNAARARFTGIEVDVEARPAAWLAVAASAALTDHRYVEFPTDSTPLDGRRVPGVPTATATALARFTPGRGARAELEVAHAGRAFGDDANTAAAAAWTVVHLRASWDGRRLAPLAGVRNVFDTRYVGSINVNGALRRYYEPGPGRSWYVGMEMRIGG